MKASARNNPHLHLPASFAIRLEEWAFILIRRNLGKQHCPSFQLATKTTKSEHCRTKCCALETAFFLLCMVDVCHRCQTIEIEVYLRVTSGTETDFLVLAFLLLVNIVRSYYELWRGGDWNAVELVGIATGWDVENRNTIEIHWLSMS